MRLRLILTHKFPLTETMSCSIAIHMFLLWLGAAKKTIGIYLWLATSTDRIECMRSGITTGFCEVQGKRSMKNGAVAWDGIYGRIHMAALKLQLWILISALCAKGEIPSFFSSRARNWLPPAQPRKIFHLFYTFSLRFFPSHTFNKA